MSAEVTRAKGSRVRALVFLGGALALAAGSAGAHARKPRASGVITAEEQAKIGASLAFVREAHGRREAFVMNVEGAVERPLLDATWPPEEGVSSYPAAVAQDGSAVAVLRVIERENLHVESLLVRELGAGAAAPARLAASPSRAVRSPAFSPDGRSVAFETDATSFRDLFITTRGASAEGAAPQRVTDEPNGNYEPSWFKGGKALAFTSSRDGNAEIYRANADGTSARRLTTASADDLTPRVSPDGARIAFLSGRDGVDRVFLMDAEGGAQRAVRPVAEGKVPTETEREHTWSPEGRRLAFVARAEGKKSRIFVWDADQDAAVALTDGSAVDDMPAFSPDGRYLAFVSDREGRPDLWLMRVDGSGTVRVGAASESRWLPSWVASRASRP